MNGKDLRIYRTQLWLILNEEWAKAQQEAWKPILRAVERSQQNKAALVLKSGGLTRAIVTVEFFEGERVEDALVRLDIDRKNGKPVEQYMPYPDELMAYLGRLGMDPYYLNSARWEPV